MEVDVTLGDECGIWEYLQSFSKMKCLQGFSKILWMFQDFLVSHLASPPSLLVELRAPITGNNPLQVSSWWS